MTPFVTFRAVLAGLALSAISMQAQTAKPAVNQGPYQPNAQESPFNGKVVEQRIAQVNGQIITSSDYQRAEQQMDTDGRQQGWSEQELAQRKKDLLRDLIDKELLLSKGKELQITGETELIKRLDEIRKQNHLDSMEDLEKAAQQQGVSYEDFKQNIRNEIISQQVIREQVSRKIQLTKADINAFYDAHKSEFEQPESVHLTEILIPVAADDPSALTIAQAKAAEVEAKIKSGTDFAELAKQYSSGPTAQTGGELGDFKRGMLGAKSLEDATFTLKAGETTAPIRTKQGLLILKVVQHTGGSGEDFASIEPQVEEAAFMNRMQPQLRSYLTTLREQAYIDIRPGYKDVGATGNSVKPLYAAATPVGPKPKAKLQRTRFHQTPRTFRSKSGTTKEASATAAPGSSPTSGAMPAKDAQTATATTTPPAASTDAPAAAAATAPPAPPAPAPASKSTQVAAANTPSTKPVKKQKVRFGQAPSTTLAETPGSAKVPTNTAPVDATAANNGETGSGETQVASNVSSNVTQPGMEQAAAPAKPKTRFSYRAREPKQPKALTQDQLENNSVGKATTEETAAQQTQAAPVGLAGDTANKKKEPKPKSDQKTRYSEKPKTTSADDSQGPSQATSPSPAQGADTGSGAAAQPGTGAASPDAAPSALPEQQSPMNAAPPATAAPGTTATPPAAPQ